MTVSPLIRSRQAAKARLRQRAPPHLRSGRDRLDRREHARSHRPRCRRLRGRGLDRRPQCRAARRARHPAPGRTRRDRRRELLCRTSRRGLPAPASRPRAGEGGGDRCRKPPRRLDHGRDRRRGRTEADPRGGAARHLRRRSPTRNASSRPGAIFMREVATPRDHAAAGRFGTFRRHAGDGRRAPASIERIWLTASGGPFRSPGAWTTWRGVTPKQALAASELVDGPEGHHRFGDADEQGPRADRGASSLLGRRRAARCADPSAIDRALPRLLLRRLGAGADELPGHAHADRLQPCLAGAHAGADGAARPGELGTLTFEAPDETRFPALRLAREVLAAGGSAGTVLNAANEIAVEAFLDAAHRLPGHRRLVEADARSVPAHLAALVARQRRRCAGNRRRSARSSRNRCCRGLHKPAEAR